ncbi:MAG: glycosyltransferase family 2 protein [Candidatus Omnitrophica bacterium]|nr:glycosyltransferase family 2 protein [Candidatus Omnitrophota bacterium]
MQRYSVSFVLPMYNEREGIEDTVEEVRIIARAIADDYEIIIVDDASTDGSADVAEAARQGGRDITVERLSKNSKFGGALALGLQDARKEIIIYTDADLPISLLDIKKSLPLIEQADIVTAVSKVKKGENLKRKIISWGYNFLLGMFFDIKIRDVNSGYKIFRRSILEGITFTSRSPFIDAEILIRAKERGARITEYPLIFRPRRQGTSKVAKFAIMAQTFKDMFFFKFFRAHG